MSEQLKPAQSPEKTPSAIPVEVGGKSLVAATPPVATAAEEKGKSWSPMPTKTEVPVGDETTTVFTSSVHAYINDYIKFADQKAAFVFAAVAAMLALLQKNSVTKIWIKSPAMWSLTEALAACAVVSLLVSAAASLLVVLPRKKGSPTGMVFWGAISKCRSAEEYASLVRAMEPAQLTKARLQHCHELSLVCTRKYKALSWAIWSAAAGFLATILYFALV